MNKFLLPLALLAFVAGSQGQSCGIQGINSTEVVLLPISEDLEGGTIFARMQLFNVKSTATVAHPHNPYLSAQRYANGVYEILTTDQFPNFVNVERSLEIRRMSALTCDDDSIVRILFIVPVTDINNHAPTFNEESYEVEAEQGTLVETGIIVTDEDVAPENADVHFTSSNRYFTPQVRLLSTPPAIYRYAVDLLVDDETPEGSYNTIITADDGRFPSTVIVTIEVTASTATPEPEPTEAPTTTTTTTTTEEPTTTEEATTEEPTTTTTTEEPTTEEPIPEGCGFVDLDPSVPIRLTVPLEPVLPVGTEVWRAVQFNVASTTAASNPHNIYLSALRSGSTNNYWFITTTSYNSFLSDNPGTNIVTRTVNCNCLDGSRVVYNFELEINDGPIEEPTLAPEIAKLQKRSLFF